MTCDLKMTIGATKHHCMRKTAMIVIVDNDPNWNDDLVKMIRRFFHLEIEPFRSFAAAEAWLYEKKDDFHLLITDLYPKNSSENIGARLVTFADQICKRPAFIITAEDNFARIAWQDLRVKGFFDKGKFSRIEFILAVRSVLKDFDIDLPPAKRGDDDKPPIFT